MSAISLAYRCKGYYHFLMSKTVNQSPSHLTPVALRQELAGRLRNITKLKHWQMAVAEAVQNAMDAIADSGRTGEVSILVERAEGSALNEIVNQPIRTIVVSDDGVGFNNENYQSFCTPDSLRKQTRGGKGLGRLTCLQAFQRLRVNSVFQNGDGWKERNLLLQTDSPELAASEISLTEGNFKTEVRLEELRPEFETTATVSFNCLAEWLAEHFLPALVERPKWLKSLSLSDGEDQVDLTRVIEGGAQWVQKFQVRTYDFRAVCYSVASDNKEDKVRLVAGGRIVHANTRPLDFYLPHLANISSSESHLVLIYSSFFDEHVNDARNGVSFADDGDTGLLQITAPEFRDACSKALKHNLNKHLEQSVDKFKQRIIEVVSKEAPYYRPLLLGFFGCKEFTNLGTSSKDEEILSALDSYKRRDATKMRQESRRLARLKTEGDGYWESARKLADQIETQKKVALAEYVTLRKIVLERLEYLLEAKRDGKAHREADIHNLIFPQRTDSESNPGVDHQLWILDERLESHNYLASDKPMDGSNGDRPDLLIALDYPGAFALEPLSKSSGYQRLVLVEFKRALGKLEGVSTDDLPHQQMIRYARQIIDDKALHLGSQRPIKVTSDARFYMYAVCEMSSSFIERLKDNGFTPSPTGNGAFSVTNQGRYCIEYISLEKLLEDAQSRNLAFFRRLGLEA